jgi:hypothetical protein
MKSNTSVFFALLSVWSGLMGAPAFSASDPYLASLTKGFTSLRIDFRRNLSVRPGGDRILLRPGKAVGADSKCVLETQDSRLVGWAYPGRVIQAGDSYTGHFRPITDRGNQNLANLISSVFGAYFELTGSSREETIVPGIDNDELSGLSVQEKYLNSIAIMNGNILTSPGVDELESSNQKLNVWILRKAQERINSSKRPEDLIQPPRTRLEASNFGNVPQYVSLDCVWSVYEPKLSDLNALLSGWASVSVVAP